MWPVRRVRSYEPADIVAHLLRRRRSTGNSGLIHHGCSVANDKNVGMARDRQISAHLGPPGAILLHVKPARRRRSDDAGSPDYGVGIEAPVLKLDTVFIA